VVTERQILQFISLQNGNKSQDLLFFHEFMRSILPKGKLWVEDGKNEEGKVVTNPTIGYGQQTMSLANGKSREMFQIGVAKTKSGFSIYFLGIRGRLDLPELCHGIGKAKTTGYCISFKKWGDLNLEVLRSVCQLVIDLN
jgi:hypothetical protein